MDGTIWMGSSSGTEAPGALAVVHAPKNSTRETRKE
jgi:hypothetical protein